MEENCASTSNKMDDTFKSNNVDFSTEEIEGKALLDPVFVKTEFVNPDCKIEPEDFEYSQDDLHHSVDIKEEECDTTQQMLGRYVRKTSRQSWDEKSMEQAIEAVKGRKMGWLKASKMFNVPQATLRRRAKNGNKRAKGSKKSLGRFTTFDEETEKELVEHIKFLDSRLLGITCIELRKLAYTFASKNNIVHSFNCEKGLAGQAWLKGFRKRHPEISLRLPESNSAARAIALNRSQVQKVLGPAETSNTEMNENPVQESNIEGRTDETSELSEKETAELLEANNKSEINEKNKKVTLVDLSPSNKALTQKRKSNHSTVSSKEKTGKKNKVQTSISKDSSDDKAHEHHVEEKISDDIEKTCLYCNDVYNWIRCISCNLWAHGDCAGVSVRTKQFVCELCI